MVLDICKFEHLPIKTIWVLWRRYMAFNMSDQILLMWKNRITILEGTKIVTVKEFLYGILFSFITYNLRAWFKQPIIAIIKDRPSSVISIYILKYIFHLWYNPQFQSNFISIRSLRIFKIRIYIKVSIPQILLSL